MPRRTKINWSTIQNAAPHGVARVAHLVELGLPKSTVDKRCGVGVRAWQRILPGVVVMHSGPVSRRQQIEAALAYAGPDARLTGIEACRRHGLRRLPATTDVHVLVPAGRRPSSRAFVTVERTTRLPTLVWRDAVPCAGPARAGLDAARRMRQVDDVRALLAEQVQRGLCQPAELLAELNAGSCAGSALPRSVLREVLAGVRSVAESWALNVWRRSGLPPLAWNVPVYDANGQLIAVPDGWLDSVGLAWEIDSYEWHLAPKDHARTVRRNARLTAAGIIVVPTLPSRLRDDPESVVRELAAAYHHATLRPRPNVHAGAPPIPA